MAIRTVRVVCPVWIALVLLALAFAGRADAVAVEAQGPPAGACDLAETCRTVRISFEGGGSGTVTTSPAGISCTSTDGSQSGTCEHTFTKNIGTLTVTFTQTPAAGNLVACFPLYQEQETPCLTTIPSTPGKGEYTIVTRFVAKTYPVTVTKSGAGTVTGTGINCGTDCAETVKHGKSVSLTATPSPGSVFKQWMGACDGQGATCNLTITQATETNAVFDLAGQGGTTGGGTTGGGATSGGTTGGGNAAGGESDSSVDAQVIAVQVGRSRLGKRVVRLEVNGNETFAVELTLVRAGKTLASRKTGKLKEGDRLITLPVPNAVKKGKATLQIVFTDSAGNTQTVKRGVRLGKA